jgi:hypothetical protein
MDNKLHILPVTTRGMPHSSPEARWPHPLVALATAGAMPPVGARPGRICSWYQPVGGARAGHVRSVRPPAGVTTGHIRSPPQGKCPPPATRAPVYATKTVSATKGAHRRGRASMPEIATGSRSIGSPTGVGCCSMASCACERRSHGRRCRSHEGGRRKCQSHERKGGDRIEDEKRNAIFVTSGRWVIFTQKVAESKG